MIRESTLNVERTGTSSLLIIYSDETRIKLKPGYKPFYRPPGPRKL